MKLTDTIYGIILNEYNDAMMRRLIAKFKEEQPNLDDNTIIKYIIDFKKIASKLQNRDILTYNWKDLETAVDSNRSVRIKAGKIDATAEDANLLFNQDNIRIYHGNGKKACIKYSNGYSFCIGARGEDNRYSYYRGNPKEFDKVIGTPYFVFNDNLDKKDPTHVLVIFHYTDYTVNKYQNNNENEKHYFTVTNANNDGDKEFDSFDQIVSRYPWVKPLGSKLTAGEYTNDEKNYFKELAVVEKKMSDAKGEFRTYMDSVMNPVNVDFYTELYELLFGRFDYFTPGETIESKYNAVKEGGFKYVCDLDPSMMWDKLRSLWDSDMSTSLRDTISSIEDWFDRATILSTEENFDSKVQAYVKKHIMPQLKRIYADESLVGTEPFDKNYDLIFKAAVRTMEETAKKYSDLTQLRAVTLHGGLNQVIEKVIAAEKELKNLKRKYQDIS